MAQGTSDADRATARDLGRQGLTALDAGDFATAEDRLTRAIALHDVPTLRLARAQARRSLGRLISAGEDYRAVVRLPQTSGEPAVFGEARRDAREELSALEPLIPRLTLKLRGGAATLRVGGVEWPQASVGIARLIDPGEYVVEVSPAGGTAFNQRIQITAGEQREVVLDVTTAAAATTTVPSPLSPVAAATAQQAAETGPTPIPERVPVASPVAPSSSHGGAEARDQQSDRTAAYVVAGSAVALGVGALVTGGLYLFKLKPDYDDANTVRAERASVERLQSRANTMGWISAGLTAGALIAGGVGAYLLISPSHDEADARAGNRSVTIGRTELGVTGRF